ncbi:isoprenylcysteine carboxylmethyltransferase family protein [Marivirga sp. S37H4]|uniref:Isoprenylcysteine carboxylmethyltransferase family protein n=1 Tax=Marivirga aurantiaca TaxID=2802615 RepID=A0A935CBM8_9BACT|nr:isoprenylcysteine carboxylmethyltransferase family protein [Marivirga aurantiaca]MBK6265453.1 isoprenylcysteine carboxylmethyltransferase family protein [Marivirga aurantiaca]
MPNDLFNYIFILLAWLIFGILTIYLASWRAKVKAYDAGRKPVNYRRAYVIIFVLLFLLILSFGSFIEPVYFMPATKASQGVGLIIATFAFFLVKMAFKQKSFKVFLGTKAKEDKEILVKTGIYGRIRHPLYTSAIMFVIGFVVFSPSYTNLIHGICLLFYLLISVQYEDKRRAKAFTKEYEKYKEEVPMLLPKLKLGF